MSKPKQIIVGEHYDTEQLVQMGLLRQEWLDLAKVKHKQISRSLVTQVDHKNKTVTFDVAPDSTPQS